MAVIFKQLNSSKTQFVTWTNEDLNNKPTELENGDPIPPHTFGINMDTLGIEYWTGSEWKVSGGN